MDKLIGKILLYVVLFFIISCTTQPIEIFDFPNQKEIDDIVETIIFTDSLPVTNSFLRPRFSSKYKS